MVKCGVCKKYMPTKSLIDSLRCAKCPASFHRACVPDVETTDKDWVCAECGTLAPVGRDDEFSTPVRQAGDINTARRSPASLQVSAQQPRRDSEGDLIYEVRSLREEISAMRGEVRQYRAEIADFKSTVNKCLEQITNVETRVSVLEQQMRENSAASIEPFEETVAELRTQLNNRDQQLLLNDILVSGIPEQSGENLPHIAQLLATKLGIELHDADLVHVERIGPSRRNLTERPGLSADPLASRPRAIAVRLARRCVRDSFLRAARVRRELTTAELDVPTPHRRFYINERLTRTNHQVFRAAREAGRRSNWRYVWTRGGNVFVKKEDGAPTYRIRNDKDITKFFGR